MANYDATNRYNSSRNAIIYKDLDLDLGLVTGWKITKSLGIFIEGTYLRYWEKPIYECKLGFNYLIF